MAWVRFVFVVGALGFVTATSLQGSAYGGVATLGFGTGTWTDADGHPCPDAPFTIVVLYPASPEAGSPIVHLTYAYAGETCASLFGQGGSLWSTCTGSEASGVTCAADDAALVTGPSAGPGSVVTLSIQQSMPGTFEGTFTAI